MPCAFFKFEFEFLYLFEFITVLWWYLFWVDGFMGFVIYSIGEP